MNKDMNTSDTDKEKDACCAEDCCCEEPEKPQQEYNEAVDESNPAEAESAIDELTKWRELAMRTAAEYDNYRKRCAKSFAAMPTVACWRSFCPLLITLKWV